jgi:hypothetical protein
MATDPDDVPRQGKGVVRKLESLEDTKVLFSTLSNIINMKEFPPLVLVVNHIQYY